MTAMTPAATSAAPMAHPSGAKVSKMTRVTPGTLASITPRRPPIILAKSPVYGDSLGMGGMPTSVSARGAGRGCVTGEIRPDLRHPRRLPAVRRHPLRERDRVVDRRAAGVVVEIDEDVRLRLRKDLRQRRCPLVELTVGVERPGIVLAFVEAQVAPVGGAPQRRDGAFAVGPAQCGVVPLEHPSYVVGPPA